MTSLRMIDYFDCGFRMGPDRPCMIDVDRIIGQESTEALAGALAGQTAAHGSGLANPEIARMARRCGVKMMTTDPILPALLVALET